MLCVWSPGNGVDPLQGGARAGGWTGRGGQVWEGLGVRGGSLPCIRYATNGQILLKGQLRHAGRGRGGGAKVGQPVGKLSAIIHVHLKGQEKDAKPLNMPAVSRTQTCSFKVGKASRAGRSSALLPLC